MLAGPKCAQLSALDQTSTKLEIEALSSMSNNYLTNVYLRARLAQYVDTN